QRRLQHAGRDAGDVQRQFAGRVRLLVRPPSELVLRQALEEFPRGLRLVFKLGEHGLCDRHGWLLVMGKNKQYGSGPGPGLINIRRAKSATPTRRLKVSQIDNKISGILLNAHAASSADRSVGLDCCRGAAGRCDWPDRHGPGPACRASLKTRQQSCCASGYNSAVGIERKMLRD